MAVSSEIAYMAKRAAEEFDSSMRRIAPDDIVKILYQHSVAAAATAVGELEFEMPFEFVNNKFFIYFTIAVLSIITIARIDVFLFFLSYFYISFHHLVLH